MTVRLEAASAVTVTSRNGRARTHLGFLQRPPHICSWHVKSSRHLCARVPASRPTGFVPTHMSSFFVAVSVKYTRGERYSLEVVYRPRTLARITATCCLDCTLVRLGNPSQNVTYHCGDRTD
jgi:hypothetical protein